jgi:hypothetical protein
MIASCIQRVSRGKQRSIRARAEKSEKIDTTISYVAARGGSWANHALFLGGSSKISS